MGYELIMTVEQMEKDREKWRKLRQTGIGGSDAAAILGLSAWKSAFQLWTEKTSELEPETIGNKEHIYWGNKHEANIAEAFCEETGKQVRRMGLVRSKEYPFMLADVDRMVIGENAGLECKTTSGFLGSQWEGEEIPNAYYVQCMHYMAVTGCDKWYIACLIGGNHFIWKEIPRNEEEIKALIEAEKSFWEHNVIAKELPPVDGSKACSEAIAAKFTGGETEPAELEMSFDVLCNDLAVLKQERARLDKVITEKENQIKLQMGNREYGRTACYNIWYRSGGRKTFNIKQFEKDYPAIYEKYVGKTPYRRLEIKISKARTRVMQ